MLARNVLIRGYKKDRSDRSGLVIMEKQEYIFESQRKRSRKKKALKPLDLEYIHQKDGFYDGKIFYSHDKVTHTFVHNDEVIVLHYDLTKNSIFLKGHKIISVDSHPDLEYYLAKFKKCLLDNPKTLKFVRPFDLLLSSLCETN